MYKGKGKSTYDSPLDDEAIISTFSGSVGFSEYSFPEDGDMSHGKKLLDSNVECIIDSSASTHMTKSVNLFNKKHLVKRKQIVVLPDGSYQCVKYYGDVKLIEGLSLHNVLHLPQFKYNLLSMSALLKEGFVDIHFSTDHCYIQDKSNRKILAVGWQEGGIYKLDRSSFESKITNSCFSVIDKCNKEPDIWHLRLGHVSFNTLLHIPQIKVHCNSTNCLVCPQAKQTRLSFNKSITTTSHVFQLIHMDLWGPYKLVSKTRGRYMLTLVDDFSRFTWLILLKSKDQAVQAIRVFLNTVSTQLNATAKCIRTGNGSEFISTNCRNLLQERGIIHQKSCTYTP